MGVDHSAKTTNPLLVPGTGAWWLDQSADVCGGVGIGDRANRHAVAVSSRWGAMGGALARWRHSPAIANAVVDVLVHLVVTHLAVPIPPNRVWVLSERAGWHEAYGGSRPTLGPQRLAEGASVRRPQGRRP